MNSKFANIAMIVIFALVTATFASLKSTKASTCTDVSIMAHDDVASEAQSESLPRALIPDRSKVRARTMVIASTANFGPSVRRAPIRRKGHVRH